MHNQESVCHKLVTKPQGILAVTAATPAPYFPAQVPVVPVDLAGLPGVKESPAFETVHIQGAKSPSPPPSASRLHVGACMRIISTGSNLGLRAVGGEGGVVHVAWGGLDDVGRQLGNSLRGCDCGIWRPVEWFG
ncbi:hypothetical protein PG984_014717 [Apiospora sp. TS-2023a]